MWCLLLTSWICRVLPISLSTRSKKLWLCVGLSSSASGYADEVDGSVSRCNLLLLTSVCQSDDGDYVSLLYTKYVHLCSCSKPETTTSHPYLPCCYVSSRNQVNTSKARWAHRYRCIYVSMVGYVERVRLWLLSGLLSLTHAPLFIDDHARQRECSCEVKINQERRVKTRRSKFQLWVFLHRGCFVCRLLFKDQSIVFAAGLFSCPTEAAWQQGLGSKCTRVCRMHPLRTAILHHVSVHDLSSCSLPLTSKHRSATRFASHKFVPLCLRGAHVVVVLFNKLQQRRSQWFFLVDGGYRGSA